MAIAKSKMCEYYRAYVMNGIRDLNDVYGRYSTAKYRAWRNCAQKCAERNGYGLSVITHNADVFTAGFLYDSEMGKMFYAITPSYVGEICVEDAQND